MTITPKHRLGEPQSPRQFTDREDYIETCTKVVSTLPLKDNKIINYYGVGGIGKTALRKELCRLLKEEYTKIIFAVLDFALPSNRDVENALFLMKRDLHRDYKIQFHSFDLAYAWYWQTFHPQTSLKKAQPFFLEESSLLADAVSLIGDIPAVQWAPKIINHTSKGYSRFKEWWTKRGIPELHKLQMMEPVEMMEWLSTFFGYDLKNFQEDAHRSMILFL